MNLNSAINGINKHLKSVFDMFGGQSTEYMNALNEVRQSLPDEVLNQTARQGNIYDKDIPTEPLQISQGKNAKNILSNFESDLSEIRSQQKQSGSALEQAQKYIDDLKAMGKKFTKQNIQELSNDLYNFRNNVNDWYLELEESEYLDDDEKEEVKRIYSELASTQNDPVAYEQSRRELEKYYARHMSRMRAAQETDEPNPETLDEFDIDPMELI